MTNAALATIMFSYLIFMEMSTESVVLLIEGIPFLKLWTKTTLWFQSC